MKEKNNINFVILNPDTIKTKITGKIYPVISSSSINYMKLYGVCVLKEINLSKEETINLISKDEVIRDMTKLIIFNRYLKLNIDEGEE